MDDPLLVPSLADLRRRRGLKWRLYGEDVLPLWVAEMDVLPPEPVTRAVTDAMALGDTGYPWAPDYVDAVADFAGRHWGWAPEAGRTRLVPNVMLGISEVLRLLTGPGDAVVVNCPVYPPFYAFVRNLGRRVVEAPLGPDGRIDLQRLASAFGDARRDGGRAAYLLASPHNPTGVVHTEQELTAAGELAADHGVRVVVDEIHAPLVHAPHRFVPYLSLPVGAAAFSVFSASKGFNLAGLTSAVAMAGEEAASDLAAMPQEVAFGASHVGSIAQAAALREGDEWLDALLGGLDRNRQLLRELLADRLPGVGYSAPEGTYLAWLDFRPLGLGDDPAGFLREHAKVALSPGPDFGTGGAGHARLNFATSPAVLTEAVERMARAVGDRAVAAGDADYH
ncbi:aminotransferase class I/II-fold pyridoxal phosphate-dependent enzyme [Phycicoccus sp. SLBN-51]|uniref:MalY/PatB family protein n=1 Tax=Phycicoccus sp. SLBN-51 TaxID=2768447 RepID=UPI00114F7CA1|nr:aminotransferase class I/II-fold pyridoxal phosphate-dependent enzyme [Phycicoccus sp. SLBN-51]TQJ50776.1 cystathionine beta-lyase [Phycicoccus sp. SLBN-51]